jgi:hypothetical protein
LSPWKAAQLWSEKAFNLAHKAQIFFDSVCLLHKNTNWMGKTNQFWILKLKNWFSIRFELYAPSQECQGCHTNVNKVGSLVSKKAKNNVTNFLIGFWMDRLLIFKKFSIDISHLASQCWLLCPATFGLYLNRYLHP